VLARTRIILTIFGKKTAIKANGTNVNVGNGSRYKVGLPGFLESIKRAFLGNQPNTNAGSAAELGEGTGKSKGLFPQFLKSRHLPLASYCRTVSLLELKLFRPNMM